MALKGCDVDRGVIWSNFWHFLENTKKQRSSCCWWGWWQHWSPSQQHMGRVHGWEHTNASLHGPCASPWLTKSMGNLKQESCHSQTRVTHQPLQDWDHSLKIHKIPNYLVHIEVSVHFWTPFYLPGTKMVLIHSKEFGESKSKKSAQMVYYAEQWAGKEVGCLYAVGWVCWSNWLGQTANLLIPAREWCARLSVNWCLHMDLTQREREVYQTAAAQAHVWGREQITLLFYYS